MIHLLLNKHNAFKVFLKILFKIILTYNDMFILCCSLKIVRLKDFIKNIRSI